MATPEQLYSVQARQNEIWRRLKAGSLTVEDVLAGTQGILDGVYPVKQVSVNQPSWYVSPEQQLERVKQLNAERKWGFSEADFPSVPANFIPRTPTEVLLLAVYLPKVGRRIVINGLQRTFDEQWELVNPPRGFVKWRWDELKSDFKHLREAPGYEYQPGIRWMAFDPNACHKMSPKDALKQGMQLAGTEVLMAALLFPDWATSWNGQENPYPNLSGLQLYWDSDWSYVPYLGRWDDNHQLRLNAFRAGYADDNWSSPSVREC